MPAITVPEKYASGLARLTRLSAAQVDAIVHSLGHASEGTNRELFTLLKPVLTEVSSKDLKDLVDALRSLYSARTGMDFSSEDFASALVSAIRQREDGGAHTLQPVDFDHLKETFTRLLNIRPLSMISKARDLLYDHENTFCDAKIITDMRPVFDTDVREAPAGIVITQTLKLEYHQSGKHTELHIALDRDDIEALLSILLRAQEKAATLTSILGKTDLLKLCE